MKIVVGMSGGVDSAVTAILLKEAGHDVTGVTVRTRNECINSSCGAEAEINDAKETCHMIGIPHEVTDGTELFEKAVVSRFVSEYMRGRTPNPCVVCNRDVKFRILYEYAVKNGYDRIATGHYADVVKLENGRYAIKRAEHPEKDQSYVLYGLGQDILGKLMLPLHPYLKEEIRAIAEQHGLNVAKKKDSMDLCFVPDGDYVGFIKNRAGDAACTPGNFVDASGKVLGRHEGIIHYTIGQRRYLNISLGKRTYVSEIRPDRNEVVLSSDDDTRCSFLAADNVVLQAVETLAEPIRAEVKIRYNHKGAAGVAWLSENGDMYVTFGEPVRAVTPGQSVVLYENGVIIGGGVIREGGKK